MKLDNLDTFLNFRIEKNLQEKLDTKAKAKGTSRAELARQYFKLGLKLPEDVPLTFSKLLYERTTNTRDAKKVRKTAIDIITEMFS